MRIAHSIRNALALFVLIPPLVRAPLSNDLRIYRRGLRAPGSRRWRRRDAVEWRERGAEAIRARILATGAAADGGDRSSCRATRRARHPGDAIWRLRCVRKGAGKAHPRHEWRHSKHRPAPSRRLARALAFGGAP